MDISVCTAQTRRMIGSLAWVTEGCSNLRPALIVSSRIVLWYLLRESPHSLLASKLEKCPSTTKVSNTTQAYTKLFLMLLIWYPVDKCVVVLASLSQTPQKQIIHYQYFSDLSGQYSYRQQEFTFGKVKY